GGLRRNRDEHRRGDRLEAAVEDRGAGAQEGGGGGGGGERDSVAGEGGGAGTEAGGAAEAGGRGRPGGGGVGDRELEVAFRRVPLVGGQPVGRAFAEVLARARRDEAPAAPLEEQLGEVLVGRGAVGGRRRRELHPPFVAGRDRDDRRSR